MTFGELNNEIVGSHTDQEWSELVAHYGNRCHYCASPVCVNSKDRERELTKDHLRPTSRGGVDFIWNIVPACWRCNRMKGDRTAEEFLADRPAFSEAVDKKPQIYTAKALSRTKNERRPAVNSVEPCVSDASDLAQQFVANLAPRHIMDHTNHPDFWKQRRDLLRRQAASLYRRGLEAAGQLCLILEAEPQTIVFAGMDLEKRPNVAERRAELNQQVADLQRKKA
jgi:hypothetical protein